jgi:hypothetical protein
MMKRLSKAQTEIISTIILTSIGIAIGSALFYLTLTWVNDYSYKIRISNTVEGSRYDFYVGIEDAYVADNTLYLVVRIIRIGSLQLVGVSPLITAEATNNLLTEPGRIWYTNFQMISVDNVYYSEPFEPSNVIVEQLSFTQCNTPSNGLIMLSSSYLYVKAQDGWVSLKDVTRGVSSSVDLCKLPLPPAPLGQLVVKIGVPQGYQWKYIVVSLWIMIGNNAYNIENIIYPNIY